MIGKERPKADGGHKQQSADSVEKVASLSELQQNLSIGKQGSTQHDGTVIEWAGTPLLLVQPKSLDALSTASVILMNSSFLLIVSSAPRTFSATSTEPRCSTQSVSSRRTIGEFKSVPVLAGGCHGRAPGIGPCLRLALGGIITSSGGDGRKISVCQCPSQEIWRWRAGMDLVAGSSGSLLQLLSTGGSLWRLAEHTEQGDQEDTENQRCTSRAWWLMGILARNRRSSRHSRPTVGEWASSPICRATVCTAC
ncbi:hypothetical protein ABIA60_004175 [Pseudomonas frederiksbergensis]